MTDVGPSSKTGPVLIIDDEVDLLQSYARILGRMGFEVITAELGQIGLSIARSREVSLVIVDLRLPDIDGLDLVRALKAVPEPPPIIVATGFSSPSTRKAAMQAGATGYLAKPFSVLALTALVRDVIGTL